MDHSPRECKICGKSHCLAGCVPVEECYKTKEKNMPVIGVVQNVLEKRWTEKGYRLLEDEDFVRLYSPGKSDPDVFSSCGATQESINKHIATIEGEM